QRAGLHVTHVPYKGAAPMYVDLFGGQIQMSFAHITSILPFIKAGRVRPLTETGAMRVPVLPDVPTMAEAGFADFSVVELSGLIGPGHMPRAVVQQLNRAVVELMHSPAMRDRLVAEGAQI